MTSTRVLCTILDHAIEIIASAGPTPRLDAEVLLAHVLGASRTSVVANPGRRLMPAERDQFLLLIERRRLGEPIAYLVGRREFWSLDLTVSPDTLIPRPETELLVERALAHVPASAERAVADLGTGCGAIALAIARERPRAHVLATDCSRAALAVARANAARLGIGNVEFLESDWLDALGDRRSDVIASNPPYLRADDPHLNEGDVRFEPRTALVGGGDGLDALRRIATTALAHLTRGGWLILEHGFDQAHPVRTRLIEAGYCEIRSHIDLAGHERVTEARAP
jgi:release factor glutamine methyltransferase